MDFGNLLNDTLPLVVAILTILTAGGGVGLWLVVLSSRQKQTQTSVERLEKEFDEFFAALYTRRSNRVEALKDFRRSVERRWP